MMQSIPPGIVLNGEKALYTFGSKAPIYTHTPMAWEGLVRRTHSLGCLIALGPLWLRGTFGLGGPIGMGGSIDLKTRIT